MAVERHNSSQYFVCLCIVSKPLNGFSNSGIAPRRALDLSLSMLLSRKIAAVSCLMPDIIYVENNSWHDSVMSRETDKGIFGLARASENCLALQVANLSLSSSSTSALPRFSSYCESLSSGKFAGLLMEILGWCFKICFFSSIFLHCDNQVGIPLVHKLIDHQRSSSYE